MDATAEPDFIEVHRSVLKLGRILTWKMVTYSVLCIIVQYIALNCLLNELFVLLRSFVSMKLLHETLYLLSTIELNLIHDIQPRNDVYTKLTV